MRYLLSLFIYIVFFFLSSSTFAASVTLGWDTYTEAHAGFGIYRGEGGCTVGLALLATINDPQGTLVTYTDTTVFEGYTYAYAITALPVSTSDTLESEKSNIACATTVQQPPGPDLVLIPRINMSIASVDSQEVGWEAIRAIDGNTTTSWHTQWINVLTQHPHTLTINLGAAYAVGGMTYLPYQSSNPTGMILGYQVFVSLDGQTWGSAVASGTFAANEAEKAVVFVPKTAQFIRLVSLSSLGNAPYASAAEIRVYRSTLPPPPVLLPATLTSTPVMFGIPGNTPTLGKGPSWSSFR